MQSKVCLACFGGSEEASRGRADKAGGNVKCREVTEASENRSCEYRMISRFEGLAEMMVLFSTF